MTIKEFSNKNSLALFYSNTILFLLVVILFFALAYEGGKTREKLKMEDYKNKESQLLNNGQSKNSTETSITVNVIPE
jgi:hypothetical protein